MTGELFFTSREVAEIEEIVQSTNIKYPLREFIVNNAQDRITLIFSLTLGRELTVQIEQSRSWAFIITQIPIPFNWNFCIPLKMMQDLEELKKVFRSSLNDILKDVELKLQKASLLESIQTTTRQIFQKFSLGKGIYYEAGITSLVRIKEFELNEIGFTATLEKLTYNCNFQDTWECGAAWSVLSFHLLNDSFQNEDWYALKQLNSISPEDARKIGNLSYGIRLSGYAGFRFYIYFPDTPICQELKDQISDLVKLVDQYKKANENED